ncbi:MAG TPA: protein kinase [Anaerolineales bacterium]
MLFGDQLIGQQLANFRIERLLGRGGMAKVYFGWDVKLQRPVAIKVIREEFRNDPAYTERFVREARMVATWQHANIPHIYHAGEEEGVSYFAMEYVQGENLASLLKKYADEGRLPPFEDVLKIGKAVAEALDYAHQRGVIHRDVTPANVMLAEDDRIMLMDFGLARAVVEETRGEVLGSPHYVSPEQARNSAEAVPQSDLYSLGVILYEMLVGEVPFDDPSPTSLAMNHIVNSPPAPRDINPDLNPAVERVLLKALGKSPAQRYQSGRELIEALQRALEEETVDSVPSTLAMLPEKTRPIPSQQSLISTRPAMIAANRQEVQHDKRMAMDEDKKESKPGRFPFKTTPWVLGGFGCGIFLIIAALILLTSVSLASVGRDRATETKAVALLVTSSPSPGSGLVGAINSTPTATPSKTITRTPTNSQTQTPTRTLTRTPTLTASPSATATHTNTPTITPAWDFALVILTNGDDSLFVVNVGERDFPLEPLEIKNQRGEVTGDEWEVELLEKGECVAVWKDSGKPKPPKKLDCDQVGERLERDGEHKFWTSAYEVFYADELIETCTNFWEECEVTKRLGD